MGGLFDPSENTSTSSSTSGPSQQYQDAYAKILKQAQGIAKTPYNSATESQVAGFAAPQTQAFGQVQSNQGVYQPYMQQAGQYAQQGAAPSYANVQSYMNPYQQSVIDATQSQFDTQNARQLQDVRSQAAKQGALGGSGRQVAEALTKEAQMNAQNPVIAGLYNQGYSQALGASQSDASRALQASQVTSGLGGQAQQYGYNDVNALLGIGGMQQGLQQAQYDTATANAQQQAAYPYQQLQWLSGIASGLGGASGTTSTGTQTTPGPSMGQQIIGAAAAGAGMMMSDERIKEDIAEIGATHDGQPIYRYRYAGDPRMQIGLMAQDVEKSHPDSVGSFGGIKAVDYRSATEDAARQGYEGGGTVLPFPKAKSYIPEISMSAAHGGGPSPSLAQASGASQGGMGDLLSSYKQAHSALSGLGSLGQSMRTTTDPASGFATTVNPSGASGWGNYIGNMASGFGFSHGGIVRPGYADGGDVLDLFDDGTGVYGEPTDNDDGMSSFLGQQPSDAGLASLAAMAPAQPHVGSGVAPVAQPESGTREASVFGVLSDPVSQALTQAGFGIMASRSPNIGNAIGEGGLHGAKAYEDAKTKDKSMALSRQKIGASAAALQERARMAAEALKVKQSQAEAMIPYRQAQIKNWDSLSAAREREAEMNNSIMEMLKGGGEGGETSGVAPGQPQLLPQSFNGPADQPMLQPASDVAPSGDPMLQTVADETQAPTAATQPEMIDTPFGRMTRERAMKMGGAMLLNPKYSQAGKSLVDLAQGGHDPGLAKPTVNALEEKSMNSASQLSRLGDIEKRFDQKWLEVPKRLEMLGASWSAKAGQALGGKLAPDKEMELRDYAQFRSASVNNLNTILKEMSGAAVTPQEYERIQNDQPVAGTGIFDGDDPVSFKAKLDRNTQTLKSAIARYNYMRSKGLNFDKNSLDQFLALDEVPAAIDKRGSEIEMELKRSNPRMEPGALDSKVRTQLKREFGI
jgi:hypothetical protein